MAANEISSDGRGGVQGLHEMACRRVSVVTVVYVIPIVSVVPAGHL